MKIITAEELDKKFDNDEDVSSYMDFTKVKRLNSVFKQNREEYENINIFFPKSFMKIIDEKIKNIGIDRESFIKIIVAERLNIFESVNFVGCDSIAPN